MGKEVSFQKMVLRKLDIHMQRNEVETLHNTMTKIISKWIKDLKVRVKTIKLLKGNIKIHLTTLDLGKIFLDATGNQRKNRQIGLHQN